MTGIHNKLTRFETPLFKRLLLESFLALANEIGTFRYQIHDLACRFEQEKRFLRKKIFYQNLTTGRVLRKKMYFFENNFFQKTSTSQFFSHRQAPTDHKSGISFWIFVTERNLCQYFYDFFLNRACLKSFQIKLTK